MKTKVWIIATVVRHHADELIAVDPLVPSADRTMRLRSQQEVSHSYVAFAMTDVVVASRPRIHPHPPSHVSIAANSIECDRGMPGMARQKCTPHAIGYRRLQRTDDVDRWVKRIEPPQRVCFSAIATLVRLTIII